MRILFDTYAPDVAPEVLGGQGLVTAQNAWKEPAGYRRAGAWDQLSSLAALDSRVCGGILGRKALAFGYDTVVGTTDKLYTLDDVSDDWIDRLNTTDFAGGYGVGSGQKWDFAQFNEDIIAVCGDADSVPPQSYTMQQQGVGDATNFAELDADAPYGRYVATVGEHLVMGYVKGRGVNSGVGTLRNGIWWSSVGNHTSWPEVGTAAAVAAQSDYRELSGSGGHVTGIIGRSDAGFVFQQAAIWQMDYVGGATMFEINNISSDHGAFIRGCAVDTPAGIFFLDNAGLYKLGSNGVEPVGVGRFSNTFKDEFLNAENADEDAHFVADPSSSRLFFINPLSTNECWVYDWALDELTHVTEALECVIQYRASGSGFPRLCGFREGVARYVGNISISSAEDDLLDAVFETGDIEPNPGGTATLTSARPLAQGNTFAGTIKVASRYKMSDAVSWGSAKTLNDWEEYDCSEDGRYFRFQMTWATGTGTVTGLDADFVPSGDR